MADARLPLIPITGEALQNGPSVQARIVGEMVEGALALAQAADAFTLRFMIGDHEFCEPDYRQILLWAEKLAIKPEVVIDRLLDNNPVTPINFFHENEEKRFLRNQEFQTRFENGRIIALRWRAVLLPLLEFEWVDGLVIEKFEMSLLNVDEPICIDFAPRLPQLIGLSCLVHSYKGATIKTIDLVGTPNLQFLSCYGAQLDVIDLSGVPRLIELECGGNRLSNLNLYPVPELEVLRCSFTPFDQLDLSGVPHLLELNCCYCDLEMLDLSSVPELQELECAGNIIDELDLSCSDYSLTYLDCSENKISKLTLSDAPNLRGLKCYECRIEELDLSAVPDLEFLICSHNELARLDLSSVPNLIELWCEGNNLEELDIRPLRHLKELHYDAEKTRLIQRSDQNF